jgi:hypothetical protein
VVLSRRGRTIDVTTSGWQAARASLAATSRDGASGPAAVERLTSAAMA